MSKTNEWIAKGTVIVRKRSRLSAEITGFTEAGNPIVEYDDDGSVHDYWTSDEVAEAFEPWREGTLVRDRTGKGRFSK